MSSLWNEKLAAFREQVASASPTPGGGSAAMVSAALGCGLLIMSAEVSLARENADPKLKDYVSHLRKYHEKLAAHADQDITVYEGYVAARKLPKITQAEIAERDMRLSEALRSAADAPIAAAEDIIATLGYAQKLAPLVNITILSDVGAGAALLHGALEATLYTLQANIRSMKSTEEKMQYAKALLKLAKQAEEHGNEIARIVSSRLAG
jgi:formiminotetrahydrofolate cyclodeaminase